MSRPRRFSSSAKVDRGKTNSDQRDECRHLRAASEVDDRLFRLPSLSRSPLPNDATVRVEDGDKIEAVPEVRRDGSTLKEQIGTLGPQIVGKNRKGYLQSWQKSVSKVACILPAARGGITQPKTNLFCHQDTSVCFIYSDLASGSNCSGIASGTKRERVSSRLNPFVFNVFSSDAYRVVPGFSHSYSYWMKSKA